MVSEGRQWYGRYRGRERSGDAVGRKGNCGWHVLYMRRIKTCKKIQKYIFKKITRKNLELKV